MARFSILTLTWPLLLQLSTAAAQSNSDNIRVYAAVAYINHGEKTPLLGDLQQVLTPAGAQQMYRQGSSFRARYTNSTVEGVSSSTKTPIRGLNSEAANNLQVSLTSTDDEWVVTSALAFYQGLYPPTTDGYISSAGGSDLSKNLAGNGSDSIEYPLDGYQYPNLQTLSSHNSDSPSLQGTVGCTAWNEATNIPLRERNDMEKLFEDNIDFYMDLFSSGPLDGTIPSSYPKFWNAYELYEYVSYMYDHNETLHDSLEDADSTLSRLESNALQLELAKNTRPGNIMDEVQRDIYSVAGRTLGIKVADLFRNALSWDFDQGKLNILVGSYEPLLALLSVSKILTRENLRKSQFERFPQPGAALVFELIGDATDEQDGRPPSEENLRVRFYYKAGADEDEGFDSYPLFGSGYGGSSIPYTAFDRELIAEGLTTAQWCDMCGETGAQWCYDRRSSSSDSDGSSGGSSGGDGCSGDSSDSDSGSHLHPALAGLIGALIMGALTSGVAFALFALGGFRIRRVSPEERSSIGGGGGGGFRGPEKRSPDADTAVSPTGVEQTRIGSWELRDGHATNDTAGIVRNKGFDQRAETRSIDDGDAISVLGSSPVNPRESV